MSSEVVTFIAVLAAFILMVILNIALWMARR